MVGPDIKSAKKWIICESVINAITAFECFPEACCIASGGSTSVAKVEALKSYTDNVEKVIVAVDNDDASEKMLQAIWEILGTKVYSFRWGDNDPQGYDINDALQAFRCQRYSSVPSRP